MPRKRFHLTRQAAVITCDNPAPFPALFAHLFKQPIYLALPGMRGILLTLTEYSLPGVRLPLAGRSLSFYSLPCQPEPQRRLQNKQKNRKRKNKKYVYK